MLRGPSRDGRRSALSVRGSRAPASAPEDFAGAVDANRAQLHVFTFVVRKAREATAHRAPRGAPVPILNPLPRASLVWSFGTGGPSAIPHVGGSPPRVLGLGHHLRARNIDAPRERFPQGRMSRRVLKRSRLRDPRRFRRPKEAETFLKGGIPPGYLPALKRGHSFGWLAKKPSGSHLPSFFPRGCPRARAQRRQSRYSGTPHITRLPALTPHLGCWTRC